VIRTLIVDDEALIRGGFAMILGSAPEIEVCGEAADGQQAIVACRELNPDVVLMDIRMPVMDGVEATRRITRLPGPRVLMLTTFDHDAYLHDAIRAGASGFLLKDVRPAELIHAVSTIAAGDTLLAPVITRRLIEEFVRRPAPGQRPSGLDALTTREIEVLQQIARGLSNAEIAKQLVVSETTVRTHVTRILSKLGLRDRVQAVVLAYETGLVLPGR
jgi:DNA-binding NarL/FixJ family response regulator